MMRTYDGLFAWSGETFINDGGSIHNVGLEYMTRAGEGAEFVQRGVLAGIVLHLPAGAVWSSGGNSPAHIGGGGWARVFRATNVYHIIGENITFAPGTAPVKGEYVLIAGQSMMTGVQDNPGPILRTLSTHGIIPTAAGGTSLFPPDPSGYWLETDMTPGPLLLAAQAAMAGKAVTHIVWAQGHDNRDELDSGAISKATYKTGVLAVLEGLGWRQDGTGTPVVFEMPGRVPPGFGHGWQLVREVYQEIRDSYADVRGYEVYDLPTYDGIHKTPAGQEVACERLALLLGSNYTPPAATVSRVHSRATVISFSEPVNYTAFHGAAPMPHGVVWNDAMDECTVTHEPGQFQYPSREGLGLASFGFGTSADGVHFPLGSF